MAEMNEENLTKSMTPKQQDCFRLGKDYGYVLGWKGGNNYFNNLKKMAYSFVAGAGLVALLMQPSCYGSKNSNKDVPKSVPTSTIKETPLPQTQDQLSELYLNNAPVQGDSVTFLGKDEHGRGDLGMVYNIGKTQKGVYLFNPQVISPRPCKKAAKPELKPATYEVIKMPSNGGN